MATRAIPVSRRQTPPLRAAPIWLALAGALLSSLMIGGLPRTTALGSAFNPATTAVALQPTRAQPRTSIETIRRDDGPASGQGDAIPAAMLPVQPGARPPAAADAPKPAAERFPIAPRVGLDGSPRGPPPT